MAFFTLFSVFYSVYGIVGPLWKGLNPLDEVRLCSGLVHNGGIMLKKNLRIVRNSDFRTMFAKGTSFPGRHVVIYVLKGPQKFGFIASKKVGGAVKRNRAKRLMREVIRLHLSRFRDDVQVICIARPSIVGSPLSEVERAMLSVIKRAKLLKDSD